MSTPDYPRIPYGWADFRLGTGAGPERRPRRLECGRRTVANDSERLCELDAEDGRSGRCGRLA